MAGYLVLIVGGGNDNIIGDLDSCSNIVGDVAVAYSLGGSACAKYWANVTTGHVNW